MPFPVVAGQMRAADVLATLEGFELDHRRSAMVSACPVFGLPARRWRAVAGPGSFDRFRSLARANAEDIVRIGEEVIPPEVCDRRW